MDQQASDGVWLVFDPHPLMGRSFVEFMSCGAHRFINLGPDKGELTLAIKGKGAISFVKARLDSHEPRRLKFATGEQLVPGCLIWVYRDEAEARACLANPPSNNPSDAECM
ncbi:MAG: hypothetical protein Q8P83_00395 [bacterium]|nr:hypothetical protein [bacterium]